jgi:hypothetical protein
MGYDDFFENSRKYHNNDNRISTDPRHSKTRDDGFIKWSAFLEKIKSDKKLKRMVILAGILVVTTVVVLIILLMPLIIKLFDYISQNGLQGVLDSITGFLDKLLKGSAK